jgi:sugar/nucleoside kinase (ribokinase family)
VIVGAASRDIHADDPRGWRLGGTVSYSSIAAARLGVHVRALIGVDEAAASATELGVLRDAGVEVHLVGLNQGPVLDNRQTSSGRIQYAYSISDRIPIDALPPAWRTPNAALLGLVADELSDEWAAAFPEETYVALAVQGLVRELSVRMPVENRPLQGNALLHYADAIALSAEDIAAGAPPIRELLRRGQEMLLTHGAQGALHLRHDATGVQGRYMPPLPHRHGIDTTGAGDIFVAAWLATRMLIGDHPWRPLAVASAMASLSVERQSLEETPTLAELCKVLVRLRDQHLG